MRGEKWPDERVNALKELYAQEASLLQIAKTLGVTKGAVAGMISRLGIANRDKVVIRKWKKEEIEHVAECRANGVRPAVIAEIYDVTPNAITALYSKYMRKQNKPVKRKPSHVGNLSPERSERRLKEMPTRSYVRYDKRASEARKALNGKCQWPFGDPKKLGFHMCGKPCKGASYCEEHMAKAYVVKPREAPDFPAPRRELRSDYR